MTNHTPCLLVPIFNHSREFAPVAANLAELGLPCLVVDDGSDPANAELLDEIVTRHRFITLLRLPINQGKGSAVCEGLREAARLGYSHALQIDADGQHNHQDIPLFLAMSQQHPRAVISGNRIYINAPKSRMYARKLTDFWVCVNTLSRSISDSMCGFRLYPLQETLQLLNTSKISRRMDFDSDILVKLVWRGVRVIEIRTEVVYRPEITSHFNVLNDNIAISWMHTRLFFGMLVRLPKLLIRKLEWTQTR
ncbi:glycosyl transferase, group 2 family [Teredinibacter turnerae T7901]|uniref:Glycosyl transferase, group 2 family n=1 Tax=Teredinibacter turnerae (strain ATCC 39867 / T7901) TaxID=377629 RepID=C5BQ20_TERTT|nr:glycosyltransferase family 2 protein [Teredinibacter turnerae]ACR11958.1 glycosyl transferase, group 2 family [Teredinibacter turnerae T7901]